MNMVAYYVYKDSLEERCVLRNITHIHYAPLVNRIFLQSYDSNGKKIPKKKGNKWNRDYHGSLEFIGVYENKKRKVDV